ncbi:MAG: glycosyltransferase family 39 protein [Desulfobulbaceae bacterium]|nr:glycosyltransferase family 39 protein [Desulfobulbaceae bacterium]
MSTDNHSNQECYPLTARLGTKTEGLVFWVLLLYFCAKALFFALRIRERIFPDEASWYGTIQIFSRSLWLPIDSPESYHLGLISHIPSLYFFLMGKLLTCNFWSIDDLIFLRLANVILAALTVTFAWRLSKILQLTLPTRTIFLIMLTNTVMLTFVSGAINYDNLANLLAVTALYYLIRFLQERCRCHFLLFALSLLAGFLTKNVMIPYGAGLIALFLFYERDRLNFFRFLPDMLSNWKLKDSLLLAFCLLALILNLSLYGGNKLRFGVLLPSMDMVLPLEDCLQNRLFARDYVVREFKAKRLTFIDAQRLALSIRDPGDRASAWNLLIQAANSGKEEPKQLKGRLAYTWEWVQVVVARTYSVAAHLSLYKYASDYYSYYALFALAIGMWTLRLRTLLTPYMGGIVFSALFYTTILMQVVNYTIYRSSGFSGVALTGRYMFPVLIPLYIVTAHALFYKLPRWWQLTAGLAIAILFIGGEFPWFVRMAGPEWYFALQ